MLEEIVLNMLITKLQLFIFRHSFYMEQVMEQCNNVLNVSSIQRDDAITPQQMTQCCQRLLDSRVVINRLLQGTHLKVSTYYTVMNDGEITIPWNWVEA